MQHISKAIRTSVCVTGDSHNPKYYTKSKSFSSGFWLFFITNDRRKTYFLYKTWVVLVQTGDNLFSEFVSKHIQGFIINSKTWLLSKSKYIPLFNVWYLDTVKHLNPKKNHILSFFKIETYVFSASVTWFRDVFSTLQLFQDKRHEI